MGLPERKNKKGYSMSLCMSLCMFWLCICKQTCLWGCVCICLHIEARGQLWCLCSETTSLQCFCMCEFCCFVLGFVVMRQGLTMYPLQLGMCRSCCSWVYRDHPASATEVLELKVWQPKYLMLRNHSRRGGGKLIRDRG